MWNFYFFRKNARKFRVVLLLGILTLVAFSVYFNINLAQKLKAEEMRRVELWAEAHRRLLSASEHELNECDFTLHSLIQTSNLHIPLLLCDEEGNLLDQANYDRPLEGNQAYFEAELQALRQGKGDSIVLETPVFKQILFYSDSDMLQNLNIYPYVQFFLIGLFLLLSYLLLVAAWRAEQERVWVGMAKETAHQLGTPITSLMGWVENLKVFYEQDDFAQNIAEEIAKDVELLQIVAERFSKIGTIPQLSPQDLNASLQKHLQYIKQRASRKVRFDFPSPDQGPVLAPVSTLLFDWVIENLLKNALDAMETGQGEISVKLHQDAKFVYIDLKDTGKGMPKKLHKKVFEPGFSTKKRGWGLGLSLSKRIVERYHKGRIFVLESQPGQGTTFRICLKKDNK